MHALRACVRVYDCARHGDAADVCVASPAQAAGVLAQCAALLRRAGAPKRCPVNTHVPVATAQDTDALVCQSHAVQSVPLHADVATLMFATDPAGHPACFAVHKPREWSAVDMVHVPVCAPPAMFRGTLVDVAVVPCLSSTGVPGVVMQVLDLVLLSGRAMQGHASSSWRCSSFDDRYALAQVLFAATGSNVCGAQGLPLGFVTPQWHKPCTLTDFLAQTAAMQDALHFVPRAMPPLCPHTATRTRAQWTSQHTVDILCATQWSGPAAPSSGATWSMGRGRSAVVALFTHGRDGKPTPLLGQSVRVFEGVLEVCITSTDCVKTAVHTLHSAVPRTARRRGGVAFSAELPAPWARMPPAGEWTGAPCIVLACTVQNYAAAASGVTRKIAGVKGVHNKPTLVLRPVRVLLPDMGAVPAYDSLESVSTVAEAAHSAVDAKTLSSACFLAM